MTNITSDDNTGDVIIPFLSEEESNSTNSKTAKAVAPTLEDYYLYVFGEYNGSWGKSASENNRYSFVRQRDIWLIIGIIGNSFAIYP